METPSSQRRLTRSQTLHAAAHASTSSKEGTPAPSKPPTHSETASIVKGGRRVLAEIACNDSPIVGLVPIAFAGTPSSNLKSALGSRSRRSFILEDSSPGSNQFGENLLRSQVQLLLQKVETDVHRAPSLRTLCHINGFLDSPSRFAAPTPFNTPAGSCASVSPEPSPIPGAVATTDAPSPNLVELGVKHSEASGNSPAALFSTTDCVSAEIICDVQSQVDNVPNRQIVIAESVCAEREPRATHTVPSDCKVIDLETTDLFIGKQITRTLQFDSPDKRGVNEKGSNLSGTINGSTNNPSSPVRELEDDETSQWSVVVNISSPTSKHEESDVLGETQNETGNTERARTTCSVREHLQKTREESNKVELLWSDQRRASPYREGEEEEEGGEEGEVLDGYEEYYSDREHEEEGECEDLCRSFCGMRVGEEDGERKGLSKAEGKHIRFVYDSDGEQIVSSETATGRSPCGKQLRFI